LPNDVWYVAILPRKDGDATDVITLKIDFLLFVLNYG